MKNYQFISDDLDIVEYIQEMADWIETNSDYSSEDIETIIKNDQIRIKELFEPYPEIIFHDSPAQSAELLATSWGIIKKRELEFV